VPIDIELCSDRRVTEPPLNDLGVLARRSCLITTDQGVPLHDVGPSLTRIYSSKRTEALFGCGSLDRRRRPILLRNTCLQAADSPSMLDDVIIETLDDDRSDDFYSGSDGI
jgi:hypothetical protein